MSQINVNQIVDASGGVLAPISSVMRNRIQNGQMTIDQRNAGASVTPTTSNNVYPVDRWQTFASQATKYTAQQNAGSVTPPAGFTNYMGFTSSSAYSLGATDFFFVGQKVEGFNVADFNWGTANATNATLSFWVRSSLTGTFAGVFRNNDGGRNYPFSYTIAAANTWEQKTITVAGDTSGTWLKTNGTGIEIDFSLGIGSTFSGTAGAWTSSDVRSVTGATSVVGTNGATFYITGVQLEKGTQATSFEYRQIGTELALCQRYFRKLASAIGQTISTNTATGASVPLGVTMRAQPTLDSGSSFVVSSGNAGAPIIYSGAGSGSDGNTVYIFNNSNNWSIGVACSLNAGLSAEL